MKKSDHKPGTARSLANDPAYVRLGEFGRAHGLKGEIRLKSHTSDPHAIGDYGQLLTGSGKPVTITALRQAAGDQPDLLVARVEGVTDRNGADALNREELYIERARLPEPEEEDEFLYIDLIGLKITDQQGETIGTVLNVADYGGGDVIEIRDKAGGKTALLPFTKAFFPAINLKTGTITADLPEDIFEDEKPEGDMEP